MSEELRISVAGTPAPAPVASVFEAKARLLAWAEESDARSAETRARWGSIAATTALAALGSMAIARALAPRRAVITSNPSGKRAGVAQTTWRAAARAGQWLLPWAIRAAQRIATRDEESRHRGSLEPLVPARHNGAHR